MTREVLPTSQMEEETQELLDEYNETYDWSYNDMVDFIKEYGEEDFREYYEKYSSLVEEYGKGLVDEYVDDYGTNGINYFEESYQGEYESGAEFAEQMASDCGYISRDMPSWIEIDWTKTWDNSLSWDYHEIITSDNKVVIFSNNY
tara:strand:+ start:63 stop:500 length:438 start_codon:yes stop_codon:yes gene_type:complete